MISPSSRAVIDIADIDVSIKISFDIHIDTEKGHIDIEKWYMYIIKYRQEHIVHLYFKLIFPNILIK